jgi:hypothetical protein
MQMTDQAKDKYVAPDMSAFISADIKDLSHIIAGQHQWVRSFVLNSTLRGSLAAPDKASVFNFLRKADSAIREYGLARATTLAYLSNPEKISEYLAAVGHWEVVLASAYQAWRLITLGQRTFEPDDGSIYQRLNLLYNRSKHVEVRDHERSSAASRGWDSGRLAKERRTALH